MRRRFIPSGVVEPLECQALRSILRNFQYLKWTIEQSNTYKDPFGYPRVYAILCHSKKKTEASYMNQNVRTVCTYIALTLRSAFGRNVYFELNKGVLIFYA